MPAAVVDHGAAQLAMRAQHALRFSHMLLVVALVAATCSLLLLLLALPLPLHSLPQLC
jgi:hypothetical protein